MNIVKQLLPKGSDYYQGLRTDLVGLVPELHGRVLEMGCAEGLTLDYIKRRFGCDVVGIDYSNDALRVARSKGIVVHRLDLNSETMPFADKEFDFILIADVLEHLYDPWRLLKETVRFLKDNGRILVSIPNIKHYSVLRDLILRDSWEYSDAGLLDITHIRFFTLTGIRNLIEANGLAIEVLDYHIGAPDWVWRLNRLLYNKLLSFMIFQYLISAKKQ